MASRRRDWSRLGENQRNRYIRAGRKQGLTEAQVQAHYESGGDIKAWAGRGRLAQRGVSEREWRRLRAAAKRSDLANHPGVTATTTQILESLLAKGYSVDWILARLADQQESTAAYRSEVNRALRASGVKMAGRQPGNRRYHAAKTGLADIEIYYYH